MLWTANTERFCEVIPGLNDTAENLLRTIQVGAPRGGVGSGPAPKDSSVLTGPLCLQLGLEVSPSTLFAVASILEGCAFLNGSPQNTLVPGALELAWQRRVFVGGDDFKSGQTKVKSVLVDFLIGSGLKVCGPGGLLSSGGEAWTPEGWACVLRGLQLPRVPLSSQTMSIVSYNHLGNNDGQNLSAPPQFRSKEVSKSSVVDDMVHSNPVLYSPGEQPDHCVRGGAGVGAGARARARPTEGPV